MLRSNCFFFALALWIKRGGYIAVRRVRPPLPIGWHWAWSPDRVRWLHYSPIGREHYRMPAVMFQKLWFPGHIRRYDNEWGHPETDPRLQWKRKILEHGERRREDRRHRDRRQAPRQVDLQPRTRYHFGGDDRLGPVTGS